MSNKSIAFGSGILFGTPAGAAQTPVQFGTLQDCSVDFSFTTKNLFGKFQFPVAIGRGTAKISGKARFANLDSAVLNGLFFDQPATAGQIMTAYQEGGTIGTTPYQVTVANSAAFDEDLGVSFVTTGVALARVASAPATGQYSVAAGVYTFAAADTGKAVLISYTYTTATGGYTSTITNNVLGTATTFQMDFYQTNPNVAGAQWSLRLFSCLSSKLTMGSKLEDFILPEFDFEAFANASNQIGIINTAN